MVLQRHLKVAALLAALVFSAAAAVTVAQDNAPPANNAPAAAETPAPAAETAPTTEPAAPVEPVKGSVAEMWDNFLYFIRIAKPDYARAYGMALVEKADAKELYMLTTKSSGWELVLDRGAKDASLAKVIGDVRKKIEVGYETTRSDPKEIENSISMLGQTMTAYELAVSRLKTSGEFAMPQLIQKLADDKTPQILRERITVAIPRLGVSVVRPLTEVLQSNDAKLQMVAVNALAQIPYPHSAPYLRALLERQDLLPNVRAAAQRALDAVAGPAARTQSVAQLSYDLAEKYYYGAESLQLDIRYETANVWYWKEGFGLTYKSVPRPMFQYIYAMRLSAMALKYDGNFYPAVSLWIAADLKKESAAPGAKDPTMAASQMPANFYALASSAKYLQDVLARGLKDKDAAVAVGAIEALAKTASGKNLTPSAAGGVSSLAKALTYPDRQVRFLAAVSLANALPTEKFAGSDLVAPVLNEALRQSGTPTALLVVKDEAQRNALKAAIRAAGYEVIDAAETMKAMSALRASSGVNVVVLNEDPEPAAFIQTLRQDPLYQTLPVAVVKANSAMQRQAQTDKSIVIAASPSEADVAAALKSAAEAGGASLSPEAAQAWAVKAANAIRLLGLTNNQVYDLNRNLDSLAKALGDKRAEIQIASANALAVLSPAQAQQAVAGLAVKADADAKVRVAAFDALRDSVKKFGNQTTDEQSQAVIAVVNDSTAPAEIRSAAGAALGAMNLPSEKIKSLILDVYGK